MAKYNNKTDQMQSSGYGDLSKEQIDDMWENLFFNKLRGKEKLKAVCLTGGDTGETITGSYHPIKIRPVGIHDQILPDPCGSEYANEEESPELAARLNKVISLHPTCVGFGPMTEHERTPGFGEEVWVHFLVGNPAMDGQMRGLRYEFPQANVEYDYKCANQKLQSLVGKYKLGAPAALGSYAQGIGGIPGSPMVSGVGAPTEANQFPGACLPVDMSAAKVTSRVGLRVDPVTGKKGATHGGIDIGGALGADLYAVLDGEVIAARGTTIGGRPVGGFGAWIVLKHKTKNVAGEDKTIYTVYGHVNGSYVKKGDKVTKGQVIAPLGNEGKSTGPHLHFELHTNWGKTKQTRLDPIASFGWNI